MGIVADFTLSQGSHKVTQHTALPLYVDVLDDAGNAADLTQFSKITYVITDPRGLVIVRKDLNNGITFEGSVLYILVPGKELKATGSHTHSLIFHDSQGNTLPPAFNYPLFIVPLYA